MLNVIWSSGAPLLVDHMDKEREANSSLRTHKRYAKHANAPTFINTHTGIAHRNQVKEGRGRPINKENNRFPTITLTSSLFSFLFNISRASLIRIDVRGIG